MDRPSCRPSRAAWAPQPHDVARLHPRRLLAPMRLQPLLRALLRLPADLQVVEHRRLLDVSRHRHDDAARLARLVRLTDVGVAQVVYGVAAILPTEGKPSGLICPRPRAIDLVLRELSTILLEEGAVGGIPVRDEPLEDRQRLARVRYDMGLVLLGILVRPADGPRGGGELIGAGRERLALPGADEPEQLR